MPQYEDAPGDVEVPAAPGLSLRDNVLLYGDLPIGRFADGALTINLGWATLAQLHVRVEGDPALDRTRSGLVLDRPVNK